MSAKGLPTVITKSSHEIKSPHLGQIAFLQLKQEDPKSISFGGQHAIIQSGDSFFETRIGGATSLLPLGVRVAAVDRKGRVAYIRKNIMYRNRGHLLHVGQGEFGRDWKTLGQAKAMFFTPHNTLWWIAEGQTNNGKFYHKLISWSDPGSSTHKPVVMCKTDIFGQDVIFTNLISSKDGKHYLLTTKDQASLLVSFEKSGIDQSQLNLTRSEKIDTLTGTFVKRGDNTHLIYVVNQGGSTSLHVRDLLAPGLDSIPLELDPMDGSVAPWEGGEVLLHIDDANNSGILFTNEKARPLRLDLSSSRVHSGNMSSLDLRLNRIITATIIGDVIYAFARSGSGRLTFVRMELHPPAGRLSSTHCVPEDVLVPVSTRRNSAAVATRTPTASTKDPQDPPTGGSSCNDDKKPDPSGEVMRIASPDNHTEFLDSPETQKGIDPPCNSQHEEEECPDSVLGGK